MFERAKEIRLGTIQIQIANCTHLIQKAMPLCVKTRGPDFFCAPEI